MEKIIFSKSENFKEEYCVGIVRIDNLEPIEGSDFLVKSVVSGFPIVVRKDEVKIGDVMFYAMNETQLNEKFLSKNNLFEISERDRNSNAEYVNELIENGNTDEAKKNVGFFNKHGRVKMIKLRGCPSMGFIFGLDSMVKYKSSLKDVNLEEHVGEFFDTIDGELFVKAYVPYVPQPRSGGGKREKLNKKIAKFNRMIPGQFEYHYDTSQANVNMHNFTPDTKVVISNKLHGTSFIIGNVLVKKPANISIAQKAVRKNLSHKISTLRKKNFRNYGDKFRALRMINTLVEKRKPNYSIGYGNVYSSRTVIKNQYINKSVGKGYYKVDVWGEYNNLLKPFIPEGMLIYGEIFGYLSGCKSMIQKGYDYGCPEGTNKCMIYRIVMHKENGTKLELDVEDVYKWTKTLIKNHPELKDKVHPIDIMYHGTLGDLYPEIDREQHWNANVLEALKNDKEHFGMEENEPMCKTKVPREGIVIRIDEDKTPRAFKLKCANFLLKESKEIDAGNVDIEMSENNY